MWNRNTTCVAPVPLCSCTCSSSPEGKLTQCLRDAVTCTLHISDLIWGETIRKCLQVKCEVNPGGICVSGAGQRASGEPPAAEGPPGQRRPHREAEGGDRPVEQGESSPLCASGFSLFHLRGSRLGEFGWILLLNKVKTL